MEQCETSYCHTRSDDEWIEREVLAWLFAMPKDEVVIEVPSELVDDKIHHLRYKPFNYGEYFNYHVSTLKENAL
ncbi:putative 2-oxoglutarate-dependent dioxygenase AOP1 [Sesbania bispinosa]|nr:putative 2-oxoglutarate-dependent dioxygenase AOP1 [Sesbania bispinosa]